jgi:hypothetical protein
VSNLRPHGLRPGVAGSDPVVPHQGFGSPDLLAQAGQPRRSARCVPRRGLWQVGVCDVRLAAQPLRLGDCARAVRLHGVARISSPGKVVLLELLGRGAIDLLGRGVERTRAAAPDERRGDEQDDQWRKSDHIGKDSALLLLLINRHGLRCRSGGPSGLSTSCRGLTPSTGTVAHIATQTKRLHRRLRSNDDSRGKQGNPL